MIKSVSLLFVMLLILPLVNCSENRVLYSTKKKILVQANEQLIKSHLYDPKYDLNNYKIPSGHDNFREETIYNCLNDFYYDNQKVNIKPIIHDPRYFDIIGGQTVFKNQSKSYVMDINVYLFEDRESARLGYQIYLMNSNHIYNLDKNCSFDICFTDQNKANPPQIHRAFLWKNINIELILLAEYNVLPYRDIYKLAPDDYPKYHEMNVNFMDDFRKAFEKHVSDCHL